MEKNPRPRIRMRIHIAKSDERTDLWALIELRKKWNVNGSKKTKELKKNLYSIELRRNAIREWQEINRREEISKNQSPTEVTRIHNPRYISRKRYADERKTKKSIKLRFLYVRFHRNGKCTCRFAPHAGKSHSVSR